MSKATSKPLDNDAPTRWPFKLIWEEFSEYSYSKPTLERRSFSSLEEASRFGRELSGRRNIRVYGIFVGSDEPIIDKRRRKEWLGRWRRSQRRW